MDTSMGQCVYEAHLPILVASMLALLVGLVLTFALL
jgi:hypothetical protein